MNPSNLLDLLDSFHHARVLVFGDVMLDRFIYGSVERISPEAPIPVMAIGRTVDIPGGAANVARNVATLGGQVVLISVVGQDEYANCLHKQLTAIPTITTALIVDTSRPTTIKTRHIADRQQILRTDVESKTPLSDVLAHMVLERYRAALSGIDIVIISDYGKGVLTDTVTCAAIASARRARKTVLVDPKSHSFQKYSGATVLTPNRNELQTACGQECCNDEQVVAGARLILNQSICSTIVVTRGKDGMSVVPRDGNATHIRTVAKDVYDVSGAGDTAIAALSLGLAAGANITDAARLANMAAGTVVGKYGTAAVTAGEIIARLDHADKGLATDKHFTPESARRLATRWREMGLRIAFTNGCFDLLHPGHLSLLEQARTSADRLIVGLNSDLSVRRLKGPGRPVQSEIARAAILASLKSVDAVVIFEDETPLTLINDILPDVLIKGADYSVDAVVGAELVQRYGGQVILADLVPAQSTTATIQRIAGAGSQ